MVTGKATFETSTKLAAPVADLGGVVRFYPDKFNSTHFSFVLDKGLQLIKAPVANPVVHLLSSLSFPNTFKVFHYNLVSFEAGNNALTNVVVYPSHITSFSASQLHKKLSTGTSAFGLKFTTQIFELPLDLLDFGRFEEPAVIGDSKVVYSEVNAKNTILRIRAFSLYIFREYEQKKASAFFVNLQQGFIRLPPCKVLFVTERDVKRKVSPAMEQAQVENAAFEVGTSREVIANRCSFNYWFGFSSLDNTACLLDAGDSELSRQVVCVSDCGINNPMKIKISINFCFPGSINTELQGSFISRDSFNYFRCCRDFDFNCSTNLHSSIIGMAA